MTRHALILTAALTLALAAAPAWSLGGAPPAVAVGTTGFLTGTGATVDVVRGEQAYFRFVNARGGVNGRQLDFEALDDGGDAGRAATNARNLIDKDNVIALFSVVGTAANLAVRDIAAAAHVPQVFSAGTARELSLDSNQYPLTTGYPPSSFEVAEVFARHILATNQTTAKVAVLYASTVDGQDGLAGLKQGLGKQGAGLLVASEAVSPTATDVAAQLRQLKASGANTLALLVPGPVALTAYKQLALIGWQPQVYLGSDVTGVPFARLGSSAAVEGSISVVWARDPAVAPFAHDPGGRLAAAIMKRYGTGASDGAVIAGMAAAYSFVDALQQAGPSPTRSTLLGAVDSLNEVSNPFLLPGVEVHMTPAARFPVVQMLLIRHHAGRWVSFGGIQSAAR